MHLIYSTDCADCGRSSGSHYQAKTVWYCWVCRRWSCCFSREDRSCCNIHGTWVQTDQLITPEILMERWQAKLEIPMMQDLPGHPDFVSKAKNLKEPVTIYELFVFTESFERRISALESGNHNKNKQ